MKGTRTRASSPGLRALLLFTVFALGFGSLFSACSDDPSEPDPTEPPPLDPDLVEAGRDVFRYEDFGDWRFWTDTLRLHELVEGVDPATALSLGLKVDSDAVPAATLTAVLADPDLLADPAVTRTLLELDAVVGVKAMVSGDRIERIGITCALCHSNVDNSVTAGIGSRLDGWVNRDLAVGTIISLTPGLPDPLRPTYAAWPPGWFDPRFDQDGISDPVVIPPAYGLRQVELETYTGEGEVSYWNNYVAVVEMHGRGNFTDSRLGLSIDVPASEDEVVDKLPALREYQLSLVAPAPPAASFDAAAAERGKVVFEGAARCATCHLGPALTDDTQLHAASETGMSAAYAQRGTTGRYRTTPLRGLWQHAPYFHDGSAATLDEVVAHYEGALGLTLDASQRADLVEYLKSL